MKGESEEIRIFSFQDLKWLFFRKKKVILRCAIAGALLSSLLIFAKGPKYKIEATFKEMKEKSGGDDFMKELFSGISTSSSPESSTFMRSYAVLRPLVERLGLQVQVESGTLFSKLARRFLETLKAERGILLADLDLFRFQNVKFEGELPIQLSLRFIDSNHFEILNGPNAGTKGRVGDTIYLDNVSFAIEKTPNRLRLHKIYSLKFNPWIKTAKTLRDSMSILAEKGNKSIYNLSYLTRDRIGGSRIVNGLMSEFQCYLKREYDDFAEQQMGYLTRRQDELFQQFEGALKEHASYLKQNLGEKGFMNIQQEVQVYVEPYQKMMERLLFNEMELRSLEDGGLFSEISPFSSSMDLLTSKIRELEQQRDLLEISVSQSVPVMKEPLDSYYLELEHLREKRGSAQELLKQLEGGLTLSFDPDPMIASWAKKIQQSSLASSERKDFTEYLSNWVRLLSVRERILQERFLHKGLIPPEFEGIDLETSRALFVEYNNRLDHSEATMRHIANLQEQIKQPTFEIGSLSAVLKDPVSQTLISNAAQLNFQLKDEKYRSTKEGERWKEEVALQRSLLTEHLTQLFGVEENNSGLIREKIFALQQVGLDCINRQISVIHGQMEEAISKRRNELQQEKKLLNDKMGEIRNRLSNLPEKWHLENLLELKSKMNQKLMGAVAELVESKTIGHHLHHVGSKPLDHAVSPTIPADPKLFISMFVGAFVIGFGGYFIFLIRALLQGFPINAEKLKGLKMPFSGEISSVCDGPDVEMIAGSDLESIRRLCLFAEADPVAKVVSLLGGQGPDYSYSLAEVAARMGRKVCLLRGDFEAKFQESDQPGLLQMIEEGADFLPRQLNGFDYVPTGGYSRFGAEMIQSPKFLQILDSLKEKYDLILIYFRSPLYFAEANAALKICDKAVVSVRGEQIDLLTPFASWAYHEGNCRLTFVASDIA